MPAHVGQLLHQTGAGAGIVNAHQIDLVKRKVIHVTTPFLRSVSGPASTKALAVKHTVEDAVSTACPATILKEQLHACLYTDKDAGQYLLDK